jgi:hypothetical protein
MGKCGARQATDENIIRRMRFACWITKATDTHSICNTAFHANSCYANAPQGYVHTYTASLFFFLLHLFISIRVFRDMTLLLPGFRRFNGKCCMSFQDESMTSVRNVGSGAVRTPDLAGSMSSRVLVTTSYTECRHNLKNYDVENIT